MIVLYVAVFAVGVASGPLLGHRGRQRWLAVALAILLIFLMDLTHGILGGEPGWALLRGVLPVLLAVHLAQQRSS